MLCPTFMEAQGSRRGWMEQLARRPAVPAAAALIVGILAHRALPHWPLVWGSTLVCLLVAIALTLRRGAICNPLIALALALAGLTLAQVEAFYFSDDDIAHVATEEPRLAELELRIDHPPRTLTTPFGSARPLPPKQVVTASVARMKTWSGWVDAHGELLLVINEPNPRLQRGQHVRAIGMLQRPSVAMNPGQFDWARYYREQRIIASMHVPQADNVTILAEPSISILGTLRERARHLLASGFSPNRSLDHALLRALLLGDSDPELRDVQEQFKRTGTSHHLAISGLHVAVLGGFVFGICRLLCLPPRASACIMSGFVVLYGLIALPSPPVVRSVLLCSAFALGLVSRRSLDPVQLLAVTVLAMLVYHPIDLYNAGFQLSFGTVLGLMLFTQPMVTAMGGLRDRDLLVAASFEKPSWRRAVTRWLDRWFTTALAAGVVAWAVSMPLIAFHFEQLNPWAVVASIALAPVVFVALIGGLLKVILTLLWPNLAATWADLSAGPIAMMRRMVEWLAQLPGSDVALPAPPIWLIVIFYALLVVALLPVPQASLRWMLRGSRALACLAILVFPFHTGIAKRAPGAGELRFTLLAVGAGQCAVVETPSGRTILIDAGSSSLNDLVGKCVGPFLRHLGETEIDTIVLTHANYDHFSAAAEIAEAYDVREVLVGARFREHARGNPPAEALLASLRAIERPPRVIVPGDRIPLGSETDLQVLWPSPNAAVEMAPNDASLVLRLTHRGRSILITGDIQEAALRGLLKDPAQLRADVLIAPHHGSRESSTRALIEASDPTYILSSNGRRLSRKQVEFEKAIGDRLLYRTHRYGAITVRVDAGGRVVVSPFVDGPATPIDR